jgi:hypothetical protein
MGSSNCSSAYCDTVSGAMAGQSFLADAGMVFDVTLRIRGVVEQKTIFGGTSDGFWNEGGSPQSDDWNTYRLEVSDPAATYYVNAGTSGNAYCDLLDYERTVAVRGGATLTLSMLDSTSCGARNVDSGGDPIYVVDIPPYPDAFDGQFVQIDAVSIVPQ